MHIQVYTSKVDLNKKRVLCNELTKDAYSLLNLASLLREKTNDSLSQFLMLVTKLQALESMEDDVARLRDIVMNSLLGDVADAIFSIHKLVAHLRALVCGE